MTDTKGEQIEAWPWWTRSVVDGVFRWTRTDGWTIKAEAQIARGERYLVDEAPVFVARDRYGDAHAVRWNVPLADVAEEVDRRWPVPAPKAACGQVWVTPRGQMLLTAVYPDGSTTFGPVALCADEWPPVDGRLIAGPGAPWADTRAGS